MSLRLLVNSRFDLISRFSYSQSWSKNGLAELRPVGVVVVVVVVDESDLTVVESFFKVFTQTLFSSNCSSVNGVNRRLYFRNLKNPITTVRN